MHAENPGVDLDKEENIKVVVRIRPLQKHEIVAGDLISVKVSIEVVFHCIHILSYISSKILIMWFNLTDYNFII